MFSAVQRSTQTHTDVANPKKISALRISVKEKSGCTFLEDLS